ncbi:hypothetical protein E2R68_11085 [Psychromonas sp. RZ22]|uniref:FixH family protein n=1 Tax=Psychromonas algarum TaxID=2555643 RepID=UPI0010677839|nr:FixH family protein [Psychromonas sp. RZ22]TEW53694.1 hypothetical protein E2R68_11085 [Psychromonas sp. RZ22]
MQANTKKTWFKQFWPWFLIILPMAAVVAGITTVFIAVDNKPDMVVDDYYKTGKAINADLSLIKKAKELGISAVVQQQKGELLITLDGLKDHASISLSLYHSTQSKRDKILMLTADGEGKYHFETEKSLTGKWTLRIEPFDKQWRLQKHVQFPTKEILL